MLSKKPITLLSVYNGIHAHPLSSTSSSTRRQKLCGRDGVERRTYATIASGPDDVSDAERDQTQRDGRSKEQHVWPETPKGRSCPSPYAIFGINHNAAYSKAKYYELVKLYHPDLSKDKNNGDPAHQLKMERYRLIVAAHNILSDPTKRSAYDRFGAGWDGRADAVGNGARSGAHQPGPFSHSWNDHADPIWQNATWEDWERFYARRAEQEGGPSSVSRAPVYMKNSYFLSVVIFFAIIGSSTNYGRAQDAGDYLVERRDVAHDRAAKELRKVRQDMAGMRGKDERIQWFMRQREATMGQAAPTDVESMRDEKAARILRDREVCGSDGIAGSADTNAS